MESIYRALIESIVYIATRDVPDDIEDVRAAVQRDLLSDTSQKINEAFYAALRERYTVRIESIEQDD